MNTRLPTTTAVADDDDAALGTRAPSADAMAMIDRSLDADMPTQQGEHVRFTSATNGLFCAHRLRDEEAALRYMTVAAAAIENPLIDAVTRAAFDSGPISLKMVRVPSSTRGPAAWRSAAWCRGANRNTQPAAASTSDKRSSGTSTFTPSAVNTRWKRCISA